MRDRDVRLAIQQALIDTNAFNQGAVFLWGIPEDYGSGASNASAVAIEPMSGQQVDRDDVEVDGDLHITSKVKITFMQRAEDPQQCDEACELLFNIAADALNGRSFVGLTLPPLTKFVSWTWERRKPPERRISAIFTYEYIVPGWNAYDVAP